MSVRTFIIHLARAKARRLQVEKLLGTLPFEPTVLDAVDAQALSEAEIGHVHRAALHRPLYPFALRSTEVAAFLSHRTAWRRIVEEGHDAGLIAEDDVEIDRPALDRILALARTSLRPDDYLRFPQNLRDDAGPVIAGGEGASLIEPVLPGRRMFMQWVGRDAAKRLLDATEQFDRPVDSLIQMRWLLPIRVLAARPICVREVSGELGGSTIQARSRSLGETLTREIRRPLYRFAVWRRAAAFRP